MALILASVAVSSRTSTSKYNLRMFGTLVGVGSLAAAFSAGYQAMAPTGQWYGRTFTGAKLGSKKLALTYDDGPSERCTPPLLEVLAKHGVRATFFLIGKYVKQRPDIALAVSQAGHVIGNHPCAHPNLIFASATRTREEIQQCELALRDAVGAHSQLFRPPFGGRRPDTLKVVRQLGLETVMWNITGWDWSGKPADYIEGRVSRYVRGGNVILLHDGGHADPAADRSQTVTATDRLINRYKAEGYEFVTIPEMMSETS